MDAPLCTRWALNFLNNRLASAQTQEFNPVRVLDQIFQSIVQSVMTSKFSIRDPEGRKAQIKLIVEPALPEKNQNLISHHFAHDYHYLHLQDFLESLEHL